MQFHQAKQDVLLKIAAIIEGHGAKIAIPARTLYLESPIQAPAADQE